ncbi:MAG: hypothetical protein Q8Q41_00935 [bacterium]|nr:hypothetical protein [bacterium]
MHLRVYSLKKTLYEDEARALNIRTTAGELTILDLHRPLIAVLAEGDLKITDRNDEERAIPAKGGFLEVRPGSNVTVLVRE